MTFTDICAKLVLKGVTDLEKVRQMSDREIADIFLRSTNKDGDVDPSGSHEDPIGLDGSDYMSLVRGIPRERWSEYRGKR